MSFTKSSSSHISITTKHKWSLKWNKNFDDFKQTEAERHQDEIPPLDMKQSRYILMLQEEWSHTIYLGC